MSYVHGASNHASHRHLSTSSPSSSASRHQKNQTIYTDTGREIYLGGKTIAEQERLRARNRNSTLLTLNLLDKISNSIKTFKPSASIAKICADRNKSPSKSIENSNSNNNSNSSCNASESSFTKVIEPVIDIDVVISGGGLKNLFMVGAAYVLQQEFKRQGIHIARASGTSAGAWAAMLLLINFDHYYWIETYHSCKAEPQKGLMEVYQEPHWDEFLPEDAYLQCNGRLFVNVTKWTSKGPELWVISEFTSNKDLIEACAASAGIPYLTQEYFTRTFRGEYVCDGGIMDNCPVFPKGLRRQLVFRLGDIEYPFKYLLRPMDTCIDALVIRGALLTARFLSGEDLNGTIVWLDQHEEKEHLPVIRPAGSFIRRVVILPLTIGGYIFNNITGVFSAISEILEVLGYDNKILDTVLPFNENPKVISGNGPFKFMLSMISTITINILQNFNLLV